MGCIALPHIDPPTLPSPFTVAPPTLPPVDVSIDYCCKIDLLHFTPAIPLGPAVIAIPGFATTMLIINQSLAVIDAYMDAIPLDCPLE